jgi:mRNA-degrading endonuclease RelE of RelBE toxin-antitoxin system
MPYSLNFSRQAFKDLKKINEPFYSNIKKSISDLAVQPAPSWLYKTKRQEWAPYKGRELSRYL